MALVVSKFEWTDGGAQTFTTDEQVQNIRPRQMKYRADEASLDGTVRVVTTLGSGVEEILFDIRIEADGAKLKDFLAAGLDGKAINFIYDVNDDPGTRFDSTELMSHGRIELEFRGRLKLWMCRNVVLRRLSGNFDSLF